FPDDAGLAAMEEVWRLPGVEVEGVFTHFALADAADKTYTHWQLGRFRYVLERLQGAGLRPPIVHAANTAALMDVPEAHFDMVRLGIGLYGLQPSPEIRNRELQWQPAMRLLSTVVMLKEVPPGYSISYGCTYTTSRPTRVATVPIGYADGYTRLLSGKVHAVVKGQRVPCIGRICMDQCMFDVTDVPGVAEGDQVVLFGRPEDGVTADELAAALGTINYEIVCMVGPRVKRVYLDAQPGPEESAPGVRV
ncbi:MAG: alanine racemase, partial [Syntrophomonadaceae bacterium]|nr:alanine racemase [Syntrophomonadaceae bacterium]